MAMPCRADCYVVKAEAVMIEDFDRGVTRDLSSGQDERTNPRSAIYLERMETILYGDESNPHSKVPTIERLLPRPSWDKFQERYVRRQSIGSGGVADVYLVYDRALGRKLALKSLKSRWRSDRTMRARFIQEAQVMAQLDHPGVPAIFDLGELPGGELYFTMQFLRGDLLTT
jgi:serine/threonine protein kinase